MAEETKSKASNPATATVDALVKIVTTAKDRHTTAMQKGSGDEAIVAGRNANAAKNDLVTLARIRKRTVDGTY